MKPDQIAFLVFRLFFGAILANQTTIATAGL